MNDPIKMKLSQVKEILQDAKAVIVDDDLLVYPVIYDDEEIDHWLELGDDNLQRYAYFDNHCAPKFKNGSIILFDIQIDEYKITPLFEDGIRLNENNILS